MAGGAARASRDPRTRAPARWRAPPSSRADDAAPTTTTRRARWRGACVEQLARRGRRRRRARRWRCASSERATPRRSQRSSTRSGRALGRSRSATTCCSTLAELTDASRARADAVARYDRARRRLSALGLRDDALWRAAELFAQRGDSAGRAARGCSRILDDAHGRAHHRQLQLALARRRAAPDRPHLPRRSARRRRAPPRPSRRSPTTSRTRSCATTRSTSWRARTLARTHRPRRDSRRLRRAGAPLQRISRRQHASARARASWRAADRGAAHDSRVLARACARRSRGEPLLDGVDLTLARGETLGLIGPGAAGKSVLLKLLCGLIAPDAGTVPSSARTGRRDEDALWRCARASACCSRTTRCSTS